MSATELRRRSARRQRGLSLIAVSFFAVLAASFAALAIRTTVSNYGATRSRLEVQRAFYVAEGGVDHAIAKIAIDPYWAARAAGEFPTAESDGSFRSGWRTLGANAGRFQVHVSYAITNPLPVGWTGPGLPAGYVPFVPLKFADRTKDEPKFERILVTVVGESGQARKTVRANVKLEVKAYAGVIVSDAQSLPGSGGGKDYAETTESVVLRGANQYVYGDIRSNGSVCMSSSSDPLTDDNAPTWFSGFDGEVVTGVYGTPDEIPDYTDPGSPDQLFDFKRFRAAADAGRGAVYKSLAEFEAAMNTANAAGAPLEGVIYVVLDCALEGTGPKITTMEIPGGINIRGTLVVDFVNAPDKLYRVYNECPMRINAAVLPDPFDPKRPETFTSGYPPLISASKDPRGFDLTPWGFKSFEAGDDLPALIYQNGTLDMHEEINICGVVYSPSFVQIENKRNKVQYVCGSLIGGAGMYIDAATEAKAPQVFVYDSSVLDDLAAADTILKVPSIKSYGISD